MVTVYVPALPCGRLPAYCADAGNRIRHDAHDWRPGNTEGPSTFHCYGSSVTASGKGVGWAGGTETPGDAMDACENRPVPPEDTELCACTGWDGCPNPSACGTPNGCHCGA